MAAEFGDSGWDWTSGLADDENADESTGKLLKTEQDALVFLIDCNESMFDKADHDDKSNFQMALTCVRNVYQRKVINSDRDLVSLVFYGLKSSGDQKPIIVFQDLDQLNSKRIIDIEDILDSDTKSWLKDYTRDSTVELSDVFWTCSNIFSNCTKTLGYKRVMLFTNDDQPHRGNAEYTRKAAAKATDLNSMDIDIELMPMNKCQSSFNYGLFYRNILYDEGQVDVDVNAADKFEELLTRVYKKEHKRRTLGCIPFTLFGGLDMSVGVYTLARKAVKPTAVKIHRDTNQMLKSAARVYNKETGEDVMPQDIGVYWEYAGRRIVLDPEESAMMKKFSLNGLKLVGFKKQTSQYIHVKPSAFIYPDERLYSGSTKLFTALLSRCIKRKVVAVCWYCPRANSALELVHLVPQEEEIDDHGIQTIPPGFHVVSVPYRDDIRPVDKAEGLPTAEVEKVDACKAVIEKLMFKFHPDQFESPALQQFYANLEAMALNRDAPDEITDYTKPDERKMLKRASNEINTWHDAVIPDGYSGPQTATKRAASSKSESTVKKPKTEPVSINMNDEAKAGRLSKLTVAVLKEFIKEKKIPSKATKKAELMEIINNYYGI